MESWLVFHEGKARKLHMTHSRMNLDIHHLATFESFPHGCYLAYNVIGKHCSPHLISLGYTYIHDMWSSV